MALARRVHPHYSIHRHLNLWARFIDSSRLVPILQGGLSFLATCSVLFLAAVKATEVYAGDPKPQIIQWLYGFRIQAAFLLLSVQAGCQVTLWILKRYKQIDRKKVERVLDGMVDRHFARPDHERHQYRATLFKTRCCPGLGSWLGIVARSGDKYRRMRSIFSIDREDRSRNTGLAGECWWQRRTIIRRLEPLNEELEGEQLLKAQCDYIKETFLDERELVNMAVKSCVFLLTCIKVDGKAWGVLVLDSTDPSVYRSNDRDKKASRESLEYAAALLSELLR